MYGSGNFGNLRNKHYDTMCQSVKCKIMVIINILTLRVIENIGEVNDS
jgi:hypothetical protein